MKNIKLEGVKNVRDFGGMITQSGIIKSKKILRGKALDKLTTNDISILTNEYNVRNIIDLRTTQEKLERPDVKISNINYIEMPIFDEKVPGITHEKGVNNGIGNLDMCKLYEEDLKGEYLENINKVLKKIMSFKEEDGAVLFHCTAGKDRTGIIAALLLMILGASEADIIDDYLYTNKANIWGIRKHCLKYAILGTSKEEIKRIKNIFLAKEEYIDIVFDFIEEKWKNIDNYVQNCLKADSALLNNFKRNVIE